MCLGVPGRVVAVNELVATVDFWGETMDVGLELAPEPVAPGDHVLCHRDHVVRLIPKEDVEDTLALFAELRASRPAP